MEIEGKEVEPVGSHFYTRDIWPGECGGGYPYRDFELIEFYKEVMELGSIVAIEIDVENHSISFLMEAEEKEDPSYVDKTICRYGV